MRGLIFAHYNLKIFAIKCAKHREARTRVKQFYDNNNLTKNLKRKFL